jgi:hypothetical protein
MKFVIDEVDEFMSYDEAREKECIYSEDGSAALLDADELSPEEEAFMRGYMGE